jgi:pyruvate/2-oxoglutarate dehydrogenase complex dihydrolipoamide acyltransferase (E2) component
MEPKLVPRRLRGSERWIRDGLKVSGVPAFSITIEADMTQARATLEAAKSLGIRVTYSHLMVRAAAIVLAQKPELHRMVCGGRVYYPTQVDIALSVAADTAVAPLMVIEHAETKGLSEIAREVAERAPGVREADRAMMKALDGWGFLVPFGFLRRALLRVLFRSFRFRRKGSGTFQVSVLPGIDQGSTTVFSTSAMLVAGGVRDKSVAVGGEIAIKPMVTLTCCADHGIWDGHAAQRFLSSVRDVLESDRLINELSS